MTEQSFSDPKEVICLNCGHKTTIFQPVNSVQCSNCGAFTMEETEPCEPCKKKEVG